MKVLHVIGGLRVEDGGPSLALLGLAEAQKTVGLSVSILCPFNRHNEISKKEHFERVGIKVILIKFNCFSLFLNSQLRKAITQHDVIHIHGVWNFIVHATAKLCFDQGKPYIIRPCGMLDPWSLNQHKYRKKIYYWLFSRKDLKRASAIHFSTHKEFEKAKPVTVNKVLYIVPNGIQLSEYEKLPSPENFVSKHPQLSGKKYVIYLGRIHYKKGIHILISALADNRLKDLMLVIVGTGKNEYVDELKALIAKYQLESRVIFTGQLLGVDKIAALCGALTLVLPSFQENFGNVVIESLAAGCPVVISDQVNLEDEIKQNELGMVTQVNVSAVSEAISIFYANPGMANGMGRRGRSHVLSEYNWIKIAKTWVGLYWNFLKA